MGWGNCGTDSHGRPIGYLFDAFCDYPGCMSQIHRGLAYVCGDMHGEDEVSCERYFCSEHRSKVLQRVDGRSVIICDECAKQALESQQFYVDEEKGCLMPVLEKVGSE